MTVTVGQAPAELAHLLAELEMRGMRLGLDGFRRLLDALGRPQERFPAVLVGGTNGKGSASAQLASMAAAAGLRVGFYSSPHLEHPAERIRVGLDPIAEEELLARLRVVTGAAARTAAEAPTYFEAFTAAAFLTFADRAVDLAVLEVGMGGRLDATNVVEPVLSVLTAIGLDHREHLGSSLAAIAGEKAGILRRSRPAVVAPSPAEAIETLRERAGTVGALLHELAAEVELAADGTGDSGEGMALRTPQGEYRLRLALAGAHQRWNLAAAVRAAELLAAAGGPRIDHAAIVAGAARCRWPGRCERVPLPGGLAVVLDAAHNPDGVASLAAALGHRPYVLLFGALADKQVETMLPPLAEPALAVVLTRPLSPRALEPAALAGLLAGETAPSIAPDLDDALDRGLAAATEHGCDLVACGSIFLIGALRQRLRERFGVPPSTLEPTPAPAAIGAGGRLQGHPPSR